MLDKIQKSDSKVFGISTVTNPEILRERLLLFFAIGFVVSLAIFLMDIYVFKRMGPTDWSRFNPYYHRLFLLHAASFMLGLLLLLISHLSARVLLLIDFFIVILNIVVMTFSFAVFSPLVPEVWGYAMILFCHSSFI